MPNPTRGAIRWPRLAGGAFVLALSSACIDSAAFVDPSFRRIEYSDLKRPRLPRRVVLDVVFQRNEEHKPDVDPVVMKKVGRVLRDSGCFLPVAKDIDKRADRLMIVLDDVTNPGSDALTGIGTGVTFGLVGSEVTNGFVFTVTYEKAGSERDVKVYRHAIHTTVGNRSPPAGMVPMTPSEAFERVIEDLVLDWLGDLQAAA